MESEFVAVYAGKFSLNVSRFLKAAAFKQNNV